MENAVDALKIAFAVMVFTMALTLAIATFSQARETSEAVLFMNDKTNYYNYDEVGEATVINPGTDLEYTEYEITKTDGSPNITYTDKRIVGIEAIIPTLYRYYKENYTVIFEGMDIYHIDSTTKKWIKNTGVGDEINYFDLNAEIQANCPWVGTVNDIKKNLDLFLDGTSKYPSSQIDKISFGNTARSVNYGDGFIKGNENTKFLEELGEYSTDRNYGIKIKDSGEKVVVVNGVEHEYNETTGTVEGQKLSEFLEGQGVIINSATTKIDDVSGEIIELAKPTIKRVIKYTKQ